MAKFTGHTITSDSALGDAKIQRSLRFNSSDAAYLTRTPSSTGNQKVWTWSAWVKRAKLGANQYLFVSNETNGSGDGIAGLYFGSNDRLKTYYDTSSSSTYGDVNSRKYRDTNAWMNIVWQVDAANTTHRIWINGVEETGLSNNPINYNYTMNQSGYANVIGTSPWNTSSAPSGMYLAEVNHIDGSLIAPTEFGFTDPVTGIWMPKKYEGTYGTNGFNLDFSDNTSTTTLGIDKSPNGNDFTLNNLATGDSVLDTPSNNFSTLRQHVTPPASGASLTEGNLKHTSGTSGSARNLNRMGISTLLPTSGKWYAEVKLLTNTNQTAIGVGPYQVELLPTVNNTRYVFIYGDDGNKYVNTNGSESNATYGSSYTQNDIIGIYVDMDASTPLVSFSKNGQWANGSGSWNQSTPTSYITLGDTFFTDKTGGHLGIGFIVHSGSGPTSVSYQANFGQDSTFSGGNTAGGNSDDRGIGDFKYPVPSGALALCSKNLLPNVPSIIRPQKHFDIILYTGQSTSSLYNVTGLEFAPDFVWAKARNDTIGHIFIDTVRGDDKQLEGNLPNAEVTRGTPSYRFLKDGFAVSTGGNMNNPVNYVAFCWKAGGAAVTNTDGSVTSTVSANPEAGFSIVQFEAQTTNIDITVGHGLGKKPAFWMWKSIDNTIDWYNYHKDIGYNGWLNLSASNAATTGNDAAWGAEPTSTVLTHGSGLVNQNTIIMYVWAEIPGYSKFGTYTGNASTDGSYVHLGFRPALVIFKSTSASENWQMKNSKQIGYNDQNHSFFCNNENVEYTTAEMDFLSNGFKLRNAGGGSNGSGETLVYMAWAEQPDTTPFDTFPNAR